METTNNIPIQKSTLSQFMLTITTGLIISLIASSNVITLGALIFSDALPEYTPAGIGMALFSGIFISAIVSLSGKTPVLLACPQTIIATISSLMAVQIVDEYAGNATNEEIFSTIVAAVWLSAFFTGIVFLLLGRFKLGKAFRFIPYPVFGGFLAGLGWLMIKAGFSFMVELPFEFLTLPQWFRSDQLIFWGPGIALAVLGILLQKRSDSPFILPFLVFVGGGLFYLITLLTGVSISDLIDQGWMLSTFSQKALWRPLDIFPTLANANWAIIFKQTFTIISITFTSLVGLLFNLSGIELIAKEDIDLDRELQVTGFANTVTSIFGGVIGYYSVSLSTLPQKMGIRNRIPGLIASGALGIVLILGGQILAYIPKFLIGGLLIYMGVSFFDKWAIQTWKSLPKSDYVILLLIVFVISIFGFLSGVLVGLVATAILFAFNYSQINIIRDELNGSNFQSNVDRSSYHQNFLKEEGASLYILKLQGFIFFGTAFSLMNKIIQRVENLDLQPLKFVVLDFRLVNGVDTSALNSFSRIRYLAEKHDFKLVFANLPDSIGQHLQTKHIITEDEDLVKVFPDLDYAVEWCEDLLLYTDEVTMVMDPTLRSILKDVFEDIDAFYEYLETLKYEANSVLIKKGDPPRGLFFIKFGEVTAQLKTDDGSIIRLRSMGTGTIVGEVGMYLGEPAGVSVVTQTPATVLFLSIAAMKLMEEKDPKMASALHKYLAAVLSKRLTNTNTTLTAVLN